ncbi:MAG: IclR family transcriptional regulator [Alphaproteobacteria bacterium]|nr:IclR family transcriptional regulator [Alphaproteobacteria bacterium]MBU1514135.1 IclR family transcriptional regulator [Alphaproteobacteria bacterium]MBU2096216.1 IclR family transcriptional regulator [Alphaproteobacteria bacterium]MBU2151170.1 IclR family transcriptional regulator [Alphaproteobacteria bacterium]MBU2307171.1 IclR family transcriptional regulator [Alphaproteobacteria bacterium]
MTESAVKSAKRALEILEVFARQRRPLALKEVLDELGYPTSSGSALMKSLVALGYLDYDRERRTYFPTMRITVLGNWVPGVLFGDGALLPALEALHQAIGETVVLAVQSDLHAQYVHVIHSAEPLQFRVPPGTRRPLARSGMGLALLSAKSDAEVERLRRRINASGEDGLPQTREELMARVVEVRARGYAFSRNSISPGLGIIGAALPKGPFGRVFAVGVAGRVERLDDKKDAIVADLQAMIERLEHP